MTPTLRLDGAPSPLLDGTHDDDGLPPPIAFDASAAGTPEVAAPGTAATFTGQGRIAMDAGPVTDDDGSRLAKLARSIRPLSVGALMAIPTVGAASVGFVAMIDERRGMAMARASVAFLAGLPTDIVLLIGTLATGYGVARTVEKLKAP